MSGVSGRMDRMGKKFRYELHMHTAETSPCGRVPGARCAELYTAAGYDGVCVTDHYIRFIYDKLPGRTVSGKASAWMSGYRSVLEEGRRIGLEVLLCMELRFDGKGNDYLVYGITDKILVDHPGMFAMTPERFHDFAGRHGLFVAQAHPFRDGCLPENPDHLDGIEVFNAHRRHEGRNELAEALAARHPRLMRLAGSDFHQECDLAGASVHLQERVAESTDLARILHANGILARQTGTWAFPQDC